jgi:transposase InsO family protein
MDAHENARTTPRSRMLIVERLRSGWSVGPVAAAAGVCPATVRKWRDRFAAEGQAGLRDRSSRPGRSPTRLPPGTTARIEALRRQRRSGPAIARALGLPGSTVGLELRRRGLGRLAALDPKPAIIRYEREHPGELIHLDTKKLGRIDGVGHRITGDRAGRSRQRGAGWEYLHVAVDDASRLAFTAVLLDERKESAVAFLANALAWFAAHGVAAQRVMTDNGSAFRSKLFARAIADHGLTHKRTRPYTPKTNGKAERFIQTSIREWAYAAPFNTSAERAAAMHPWLHAYNTERPHAAHNGKPPLSRLARDNVLGNDS